MLRIARTAAWADLPERLGNGNSHWRRFGHRADKGRLDAIFAVLRNPDLDMVILDSTAVRAKKDGTVPGAVRAGARPQPGRVRHEDHGGGGGIKHPVEVILTAAQESDIAQAEALENNL